MPSEMFHFENYSLVKGNIEIDINLDRFSRQFEEAQRWLGNTILQDCKPYMPFVTGSLQQRSRVLHEGKEIEFPGPYARYLYGGVVMVDSVTGNGPRKIPIGPGGDYILRFARDSHLVPTSRKLNYSRQSATDHWFDTAKANHGDYWIEEVKRRAGGG